MRRRRAVAPRTWPDPPPELLSGRIEDWVRPEDWAEGEREMANCRYWPPTAPEDMTRVWVWTHARLRWNRARGRWLDEHNVPWGRQSEAVPFRWPSGDVEGCR